MKPRVFVSSTFYDLKYVREDLANFIRSHGFEPIMFEDGDIGYESGKPLDNSCYDAMKTADMAVLIIGGQHGTNASKQSTENIKQFISITNQEFSSAVKAGIPIFAFVDAKVNVEYDIYKENIDAIRKNSKAIKFRTTKDIRVFEFIKNIYSLGEIPLTEFNKISDIKDFLSKQWSDMFKKYLSSYKENKEIETIKSSIAKLESLVNKMSVMMDAVGKNVLDKNPQEYEDTKIKQKAIGVCEKIVRIFSLRFRDEMSNSKAVDNLFKMISELDKDFKQEDIYNNYTDAYDIDIEEKAHNMIFARMWKYNFAGSIATSGIIESIKDIADCLRNPKCKDIAKELITNDYYGPLFLSYSKSFE